MCARRSEHATTDPTYRSLAAHAAHRRAKAYSVHTSGHGTRAGSSSCKQQCWHRLRKLCLSFEPPHARRDADLSPFSIPIQPRQIKKQSTDPVTLIPRIGNRYRLSSPNPPVEGSMHARCRPLTYICQFLSPSSAYML